MGFPDFKKGDSIEDHLDAAQDDDLRDTWWQIPAAFALLVVVVIIFFGIRGLIVVAPLIIWVVFLQILKIGAGVFIGWAIAVFTSILLLVVLYG